MTSMTMHDQWTAPTMLSLWTEPKPKGARLVRGLSRGVEIVDRAVMVVSPLVVTAAAMFAAAAWPAPAHADPVVTPVNDVLTTAAGANAGPIKTSLAELGQSLCPLLVRPGSTLATNASQLQGNSGLTPAVTGAVTGLVIQSQCPAIMTSIANGNLSGLLQLLGAQPPTATVYPTAPMNSVTMQIPSVPTA